MTAPRNPSELQRLEDELSELWQQMEEYYPKTQKENILSQIREIENILGRVHQPYNGFTRK